MEEKITITLQEYNDLLEASAKYWALEEYGVNNWNGYDDAMASLDEEE
jgi:hypothetical protein